MIHYNQQAFFQTTMRTKITDAQIKKQLHDDRVRQLKDPRAPLYLRFNAARTGGTWWLMRYEHKRQHSHRIGTWPAVPAKHIMNMVAATLTMIAKGEAVACDRLHTVTELLQWHIARQETLQQLKKGRLINLRSIVTHLMDAFEGVSLRALDKATMDERLVQPMLARGYSISYLQAHVNVMKTACALAHSVKHITQNPIAGLLFKQFFSQTFSIRAHQVKGCRLNNEQLPILLDGLAGHAVPQRMLILMMLAHGSRIGETRQASWKDISFRQRQWTIPAAQTKNKREMIYPLTHTAVRMLTDYKRWQIQHGYTSHRLFPVSKTSDRPIYKELASGWVRAVSARQWTAHDLRKRARSLWQELGVDYIVCESLLNHARDKLDNAYIYAHMEQRKKAALTCYHAWLRSCWLTCLRPVPVLEQTLRDAA